MKSCHKILQTTGIAVFIALPYVSANAQYNQSISVEGKYVPEIFHIDRINTLPRQYKFTLETNPLNYDSKSVPANFQPRLLPMAATGWRDTRICPDTRGYLDLGLGSWLNSTLSAGYRFVDNEVTKAGAWIQHNSTSLWKPKLENGNPDTRQYRYDETIGIYASHDFNGAGTLQASASWHLGNFNYYAFAPEWESGDTGKSRTAPTQTLNDISAKIDWQSPVKTDAINWYAGIGARYFGYRRFYNQYTNPATGQPDLYSQQGNRETDINIKAGFQFPTAEKSLIGLDLKGDILIYTGEKDIDYREYPVYSLMNFPYFSPDNYGLFTLTPYYRFAKERLLVRIGADIDLAFNAGHSSDRYSAFHIAPDVKLDFEASPVNFYLHILGGSKLHTLASNYELDYYQGGLIYNTRPVYIPLDGQLGVSFGPFSGFKAGAEFAFRIARGEYLGGWYQASMNRFGKAFGSLPEKDYQYGNLHDLVYDFDSSYTTNMHGFSIGASLSYDLGNIFKITAKGNYQPQNGKTGYFNGYDRPRWILGLTAESNPWRRLKLSASYNYRGVRTIYTKAMFDGGLNLDDTVITGMRLPDITSLNFGASYGISENFDVWVQADNLLNRHTELLPDLPQQGVRIYGGVSLKF